MTPAERTQQRHDALQRANRVRVLCGQFTTRLSAMPQDDAINEAIDLLDDIDMLEAAMPVRRLLYAIPRVGMNKGMIVLRRAGIMNADRRVRDLTLRQRRALADVLERHGWYR